MKTNNKMQGGTMQKLHRFSSFSFFSLLRGSITNNCSLAPISYRFAIAATLLFSVSAAQADQPEIATPAIKPGEYQYKLVMSRDDKMCRRMLDVYKEKLHKYGYERYEGNEGEFAAIKWKEIKTYRIANGSRIYSSMMGAEFDIDNDGKIDFVIKETTSFGGYDTDLLYVFDGGRVSSTEFSAEELRDSHRKIYLAPWWYSLQPPVAPEQKILPAIRVLQPFVFGKTTYISMHPFFDLGFENMRKIVVVAKYKKGRLVPREDQAGMMEDVCYLEKVSTIK